MTKSEKACQDMADVCELAHKRTVRDCKKNGWKVDKIAPNGDTLYTEEAQDIFNGHYEHICDVTGI
jgi:hypothetical protein